MHSIRMYHVSRDDYIIDGSAVSVLTTERFPSSLVMIDSSRRRVTWLGRRQSIDSATVMQLHTRLAYLCDGLRNAAAVE